MYKFLLLVASFYFTVAKSQSQIYDWSVHAGGVGWDAATSSAVDAGGNVYVVGNFRDTVDFDPGTGVTNLESKGNQDAFIAKYNESGYLLWAKSLGGMADDFANCVSLDLSGNIYITGSFCLTVDFDPGIGVFNLTANGFASDIFVLKLDASGDFVWAQKIGGLSVDIGNSIAVDASGSTYTTGRFSGTVNFNPGFMVDSLVAFGETDVFILKLDAQGDFVWAKQAGGISYDYGYSIALDHLGNSYITGNFSGSSNFNPGSGNYSLLSFGGFDGFILKLDIFGNFKWAKQVGGSLDDAALSNVVAASGYIYITGCFLTTSDFDPGPGIFNLTSFGDHDAYVLKLDTAGSFIWAKQLGGTQSEMGNSITIDNNENVYTTGNLYGMADFDPSGLTYTITTIGNSDVFISSLDSFGNFKWAKSLGGQLEDHGNFITVDFNNSIYTAGEFMSTVDFNTESGTDNFTSFGNSSDMFLHKMAQLNVGIKEFNDINQVRVFPNPNNGLFYVEVNKGSQITIADVFGQVILTKTIISEKELINLKNQPDGVYFINYYNGDKYSHTTKLIINE